MDAMILTVRERKALEVANYPEGVERGELAKQGVGEKTIADLIGRGLLESFPHPVRPELILFRRTAAGAKALAAPKVAMARPERPKLQMLKPRVSTLDTSIAKLAKPKR
jgi:hypothetical protein